MKHASAHAHACMVANENCQKHMENTLKIASKCFKRASKELHGISKNASKILQEYFIRFKKALKTLQRA